MFRTLFKKKEIKKVPGPIRWSIGIYTGPSICDLSDPKDSYNETINPVITPEDITGEQASLVADPFMIYKDSIWYMFFETEVKIGAGAIGKIGLATSRDGFSWKYEGLVLEESFHLSYPYVFQWQAHYYMIPETRSTRSVRLYKARQFPYVWEFEKTILKGRRFADSSFFVFNSMCWLFSDSGNHTLRLYYANRLNGRWKEHRKSPIHKKNIHMARPGGRVVLVGKAPVRFSQDAFPVYGSRVWAYRITRLTRQDYQEEPIHHSIIEGSGRGWNAKGMHTLDPHLLADGTWMACVDGLADK